MAMITIVVFQNANAQELQLTAKDSIVKSSWIAGLGYNFVDDSGNVFDGLFSFDDEWNAVAYPSRVSIGRYFGNGLGVEAIGTYNQYKVGKIIDGQVNTIQTNYYGIDTRLSYDLNKVIGETAWFDPYVGVGLGYTDANNQGRGTYNAVVGARFWFSDRLGLDFSSSGKWSIGDNATNHLQHAAGVVYQFDVEKGLSKKGKEKLARIEEIALEQQRVTDSTNAANKAAEEAKALAERLAREKEEARLLAAQTEREAEAKRKREAIEKEIADLGNVYFNLNSSFLTKEYKVLLDKLVIILEKNDTVALKITSHTDSRGSVKYNKWLSERRVNKTLEYLKTKGIDSARIQGEAFGEEQLVNECSDGTYCPETKHSVNRRSEFKVLSF